MTTSPKRLDEALDIANITAAKVAARYRGYVDRPDVAQELAMWIITHPRKVDDWLDVEDKNELKRGEAALGTTLRRQAEQYCREEKAKLAGYSTQDEHFYDLGQLEMMLGPVLEGTWTNPPTTVKDSGPNTNALHEGGNWFAACTDVLAAAQRLDVATYGLLVDRFVDGLTFKQIARDRDVSETTARREVDRALGRVLDYLGGLSPWNDKDRRYHRSVVSNAQALALLEETS